MDLRDDLVDVMVCVVRYERLVSVARKKKHKQPVRHRQQHVGLRLAIKLKVIGRVVGDVGRQLGGRCPLDDLTAADDVLQINIFTMGLPL